MYNTRRMPPASIGGGFHLRTSVVGTIPHRRPQELKLPARVDGVARSNQASLLELRSWLKLLYTFTYMAIGSMTPLIGFYLAGLDFTFSLKEKIK